MMKKKKSFTHMCEQKRRRFIHNENTPILTNNKVFTVLASFPKAVCCWYKYLSNLPQRGYFNYCQLQSVIVNYKLQLLNMFNTMFDYLVSWS